MLLQQSDMLLKAPPEPFDYIMEWLILLILYEKLCTNLYTILMVI